MASEPSEKLEEPTQATDKPPEDTEPVDAPTAASDIGDEPPAEPEAEGPSAAESITMAPGVGDSQFTTTSIVTTTGTEKSVKKRRGMSKIDAANVYVYGHIEKQWPHVDYKPSTDVNVTVRPNRAQTMRQSCIMKRAQVMGLAKGRTEELSSPSSSEDSVEPITARPIPKHIYNTPKVPIKETKSSKFRYLFNRKPPGVKIFFKHAKADPKKKPPFVVAAHP